MMCMMSGFPFTPSISFICSIFILSILYFLVDLLNTYISVDKILFISQLGICHTSITNLCLLQQWNFMYVVIWCGRCCIETKERSLDIQFVAQFSVFVLP
jgi:hypothetical protein